MRLVVRAVLQPFGRSSTYRGWAHALIGTAVATPVLVLAAAVLASAMPSMPRSVLAIAALATLGVIGLARPARRGAIQCANHLLGTVLPLPTRPRRLSTAAWMLAWAAGGGLLMTASLLALLLVYLPVAWLLGGDTVALVVDVEVPGGPAGVWTPAAATAGPLLLVHLTVAYAAVMRRLTIRLLGPSLQERLAAAEAEADRVAARNRVARDLHDSIGHVLTASTIQAALARQLLDEDPAAAGRVLTSIEESSRTALDDLDRALGALREEHVPTPGSSTLADLGLLRERIAQGGTEIVIDIDGDPGHLPPEVSQDAYRIIQEGVTNALRHAPGAVVRVRVEVMDSLLSLQVRNAINAAEAVPGSANAGPGRGRAGIAERTRLLGGTTRMGPDGLGDWVVHADIPLRADASAVE